MGIFSSKGSNDANFLGVDIGGSSIKMVELTNNNGRAQLVTYGYLERSLAGGKSKLIDEPEKTAERIKKVVKQSKIITKRAVTALPAQAVFSSILALPKLEKKDLSSAKRVTEEVEKAAVKILPMPLEEMILDWKMLERDEEDSKVSQVLLTAAAKDVVKKYIDIFKKADLNLLSLETESFALSRAMVGKDRSVVVLVDIGAKGTDIAVIENGIPLVSRTVAVGGLQISQAIADTLQVDVKQAEQFKRDLESNEEMFAGEDEMPRIIKRTIDAILQEVEYIINFHLEQPGNKHKKISRIVLSGGTANLFNLSEYFTSRLSIRTFIGNPWARVIYPQDLQPVLTALGPRLATAVGLAMRDIE